MMVNRTDRAEDTDGRHHQGQGIECLGDDEGAVENAKADLPELGLVDDVGGTEKQGVITGFGLIVASIVNIFLGSPALHFAVSVIGVLIFAGLTAYDTQKLKTMAVTQPAGLEAGVVRKGAIIGALSLYLDFINLFLMLLRILGNRE